MPELVPGDLLFRWVQESEKNDYLQQQIGAVQEESIAQQFEQFHGWGPAGMAGHVVPRRVAASIPSPEFAREIEHVGIFAEGRNVIEVGQGKVGGLGSGPVSARDHTDIVVRFTDPLVAQEIVRVSIESNRHKAEYAYPFHKLFTEEVAHQTVREQVPAVVRGLYWKKVRSKAAMPGQRGSLHEGWGRMHRSPANPVLERRRRGHKFGGVNAFQAEWPILEQYETAVQDGGYRVGHGRSEPVCSHWVHAVLYAVLYGGTVEVATRYETEHIFNISPNMLWHYFMTNRGVFRDQAVALVGVQHKGHFYHDLSDDFRTLLQNSTYYKTKHINRHVMSLLRFLFQMNRDVRDDFPHYQV